MSKIKNKVDHWVYFSLLCCRIPVQSHVNYPACCDSFPLPQKRTDLLHHGALKHQRKNKHQTAPMQLKDRETQIETALIMYSKYAAFFEIVRRSVPDLAAEESPQIKGYH